MKHRHDEEPSIEPCADLDTLKGLLRQRARNLKNPRWGDPRRFPVWRKGMSTAQYIAQYAFMNQERRLVPVEFTHRSGTAPWNDEVSQ